MDDMRPAKGATTGAGIDAPRERRPGVPMETAPRAAAGVHWDVPERQEPAVEVLKRSDLTHLTATFGTTQPPHGLSGALRRYAYTLPDHRPRHWAVLLLADRVDVVETAAADLMRRRPLVLAGTAFVMLGAALALGLASRRVVKGARCYRDFSRRGLWRRAARGASVSSIAYCADAPVKNWR
jgi:hypothetical protein